MRSAIAVLLASGLAVAGHPSPDQLWQVSPMNTSDMLYAGWSQVPVVKETEVYNGVATNRTYAHHANLYYLLGRTYLIFSSAPIDEDSMGQEARIAVSSDDGLSWSDHRTIVPAALLPNQTDDTKDFAYWCGRGIVQRGWQARAIVYYEDEDKLYALATSASEACPGDYQSAGSVAVLLNKDGTPASDPCWTEKTEYTESQLFNETIYGTKYGMKDCPDADIDKINKTLLRPDSAPAWSPWLYNHKLYTADDFHNVREQTHAVWLNDSSSPTGDYWQRFWKDKSPKNNTCSVMTEWSADPNGSSWYPNILSQYSNDIYPTNIPDAKSKQFLGSLLSGDRYLIHNPVYRDDLSRQPLTIAISRRAQQTYRSIGVLRTNASTVIARETREKYKNYGFHYPTAVQLGDRLVVAYSENKENIWVSVLKIEDLPE